MKYYFQVEWGISILSLLSFSEEEITSFLVQPEPGWLAFFHFSSTMTKNQPAAMSRLLSPFPHGATEVNIHMTQLHVAPTAGHQTEPFRDSSEKKYHSTHTPSNSMTEMNKDPNRL